MKLTRKNQNKNLSNVTMYALENHVSPIGQAMPNVGNPGCGINITPPSSSNNGGVGVIGAGAQIAINATKSMK